MKIKAVYLGDWFQRTQLHLSEIRDFLAGEPSPLKLEQEVLDENLRALQIRDVHAHIGRLNSMRVQTQNDIEFQVYEDGLTLFRHANINSVQHAMGELNDFYNGPYSNAISYLFSLGAPIPKELANVPNHSQYFVVVEDATEDEVHELLGEHEDVHYFNKSLTGFDLYRGNHVYVINQKDISDDDLERFIGELVFFREFRAQLHKYLDLHRVIWENIAEVKERGKMLGNEIKPFKSKIEGYEKTINAIDTRINQMGVYIKTRAEILKDTPQLLEATDKVFSFEHETLSDSLSYVKDIWAMTKSYVESALKIFSDLQSKVLDSSVKNLTFVTTLGVGASVYKLFTVSITKINGEGFIVFGLIALLTVGLTFGLKYLHMKKEYKIKDIKIDQDILNS